MARLRGITWRHTRGYLPMVATAQRFSEMYPTVQIDWEVRSLQHFADASIATLAETFDLLVIDHPSCGLAAQGNVLLRLDRYLPSAFLGDQTRNSVGLSHASYFYRGHQWALAIDAATPVSGWRPDLLELAGMEAPTSWRELLELARRGLVALPAIPLDSLGHLFMLCCALGEDPFRISGRVAEESIAVRALEMLRELVVLCDPACFSRNPIETWQFLVSNDKVAYCPFAYGYSNYSRAGYADHMLEMGGLVTVDGGGVCRSTLGGAGLAISHSSKHPEIAAQYVEFVASPLCQRTLYFDSGGQPGHLKAWQDPELNRRSNRFFEATLPTLQQAYLRPRFFGYLLFQDNAGDVVQRYLTHGGSARAVILELNQLFQKAQEIGAAKGDLLETAE